MSVKTQYNPEILSRFEQTLDLTCYPVIHELGTEFLATIKKVEQCDLGFHPDTILSTLERPQANLSQMQESAVRGENFLAVRCAPVERYNEQNAKVELAYLNGHGKFLKLGQEMSPQECANFILLLKGEQVQIDNILWKKI